MARREEILASYSQAAELAIENDQTLTPTEFMLASSPGPHRVTYRGRTYETSYANADSARRQFTKLQRGEISGETLFQRGTLFTRYTKATGPVGKTLYVTPGKGGYEHGLWKVVVHMDWVDQDGREHIDEQRSFIVQSNKYDNYYDAKSVEYESAEAIEDHIADWEEGYGVEEVTVTYVEVIRIQTTTKSGSYIVDIP